jgi:hypothetical protein
VKFSLFLGPDLKRFPPGLSARATPPNVVAVAAGNGGGAHPSNHGREERRTRRLVLRSEGGCLGALGMAPSGCALVAEE